MIHASICSQGKASLRFLLARPQLFVGQKPSSKLLPHLLHEQQMCTQTRLWCVGKLLFPFPFVVDTLTSSATPQPNSHAITKHTKTHTHPQPLSARGHQLASESASQRPFAWWDTAKQILQRKGLYPPAGLPRGLFAEWYTGVFVFSRKFAFPHRCHWEKVAEWNTMWADVWKMSPSTGAVCPEREGCV